MVHMLAYAQHGGWGGAYNVLDAFETGSAELVAVADMSHMLVYAQHGGWGADDVLDDLKAGFTDVLPALTCRTCSLMLNRVGWGS